MNKMFDCLLYTEAQAKATNEVMEIYKYYDMVSKEINSKIRMRGISKGFICVQEDLNRLILNSQKNIYWYTFYKPYNNNKARKNIEEAFENQKNMVIDIDYLLKHKALSEGECGNIISMLIKVKKVLYKIYEPYKVKANVG